MSRRTITASLVEEIDRLLADGLAPAVISERLNVTPYVIGVLIGDEEGRGRKPPPDRYQTSEPKRSQTIDAMTLWRIERMLKVGWLEHEQVAREAGVACKIVSEVAMGKRPLAIMRHRRMPQGQMLLCEPIRCSRCGASVYIVPCRACYTRLVIAIQREIQNIFHGFLEIPLPVARIFDLLLEYLKRTQGAKAMQDLITLMSAELAAFIGATDKREHLITSVERLFDQVIEPIDLPGPDQIVDPLLRAAIRPLVSRVYDEVLKKLEAPASNAA